MLKIQTQKGHFSEWTQKACNEKKGVIWIQFPNEWRKFLPILFFMIENVSITFWILRTTQNFRTLYTEIVNVLL